jgi:DNA polymerase III alpha subunit
MTQQQAQTLWEQVVPFSGYGFNQGHATAYADVSYRSAYLKTHFPAAFFAARLANQGGFHHPAIYMAEAKRLGVVLHPPHINRSTRHFALTWEDGYTSDPEPHLWMGLSQVRDLRRASVKAIITQQELRSFVDLRDILARVPLQSKEITHLIQCGALDGLGESRAAMQAEAETITRMGSAQQMAFDFLQVEVEAEMPAQRLTWEHRILGLPMSVHPLSLFSPEQLHTYSTTPIMPLAKLEKMPGRQVTTIGIRLPGWTGGDGFFLGDEADYVIAVTDKETKSPTAWDPLILQGRWRVDEWGGGWLQVERMRGVGT